MSNILNLREKLTKSVLAIAVLWLRNIVVTFSHIFSILVLLATVQSPPVSRFAADGSHSEKKQRVLTRLIVFFDRFFGVNSGKGE